MATFRIELDESEPGVELVKSLAKEMKIPVKAVVQALLGHVSDNVKPKPGADFVGWLRSLPNDWRESPQLQVEFSRRMKDWEAELVPERLLRPASLTEIRATNDDVAAALDRACERERERRQRRAREAVRERYMREGRRAGRDLAT